MSAYIPEYVFGSLPDANGRWTGEYGLKPWPAHLQPRPTAAESNGSSESTAFLAVTPSMRQKLAATCEALIALLDEIDGDENLEETADDEPHLGWPSGRQPNAEMSCDDDLEADDCDLESGSDDERELGWQDEGSQASLQGSLYDGEPDLGFCGHGTGWRQGEETDDREQENEHGDDSDGEPFLGWSEVQSQDGALPTGDEFPRKGNGPEKFDGSGERIAKKQLNAPTRVGASTFTIISQLVRPAPAAHWRTPSHPGHAIEASQRPDRAGGHRHQDPDGAGPHSCRPVRAGVRTICTMVGSDCARHSRYRRWHRAFSGRAIYLRL